jgi:hypothetical protein
VSATFASQLRAPGRTLQVGPAQGTSIAVRVQIPEVWDVVRISTPPSTPVRDVKEAALGQLYPGAALPASFVVKLNGFEVLDESRSLYEAGARDGSTLLVTFRRRRPVR